jgi:hypothetical protein
MAHAARHYNMTVPRCLRDEPQHDEAEQHDEDEQHDEA